MTNSESGLSAHAAHEKPRDFYSGESATQWIAIVLGLLAAIAGAGAAVTQHPAFIAVASALVLGAGTVFVFRHPGVLLWTLVITAPMTDLLFVKISGITIRPYGPLTILGVFYIIWQFVTKRSAHARDLVLYYKGTLLILGLLFMSKLLTVYSLTVMPPGMTQAFVLKFVLFIALQMMASFVCACFINSMPTLERILRIWVDLANAICFYAFIQIVLANTMGRKDLVWDLATSPLGRPFSIFREPDVLGCFYGSFLVLVFPMLVGKVKFINRTYLWISFVVNAFFYLLIFVRAAWVAGMVCLALYLVMIFLVGRFNAVVPYLNGLFVALVFGLLAMTMVAPNAIEKLSDRLASFANPKTESAGAYRLMELEAQSKLAFNPTPATGGQLPVALGYGDFSWTYWAPILCPAEDFNKLPEGYVNDGFCMALTLFFNNGLIGASIYGAFLLALFINFLNVFRRTRDPARQGILCGTFFAFLSVLVCFQFSNDTLYLVPWISLGFHLAAVYHVVKIETEESLPLSKTNEPHLNPNAIAMRSH